MATRGRAYRGAFRASSGALGGCSARAFTPESLLEMLGLHPGSLPLGRFMQMAPSITSTTVDPGGVRPALCSIGRGPCCNAPLRRYDLGDVSIFSLRHRAIHSLTKAFGGMIGQIHQLGSGPHWGSERDRKTDTRHNARSERFMFRLPSCPLILYSDTHTHRRNISTTVKYLDSLPR